MALHNNDLELDHSELFDYEWLCVICFKTISQSRPPVLNLDNCSCSEAGKPINDPDKAGRAIGLGLNVNGLPIDNHGPPSYSTSDDGSVKTPDGPEARDPNNQYLPLTPAIGLGEAQHRRRASLDEVENQLSYSIRRYLKTPPPHERALQSGLENGSNGWLRQDAHLVGPTESVKATWGYGSGSGSAAMSSEHSGGSSGFRSWNIDPVMETGAWVEGGNCFPAWPREIDDVAFDDDDAEGGIRRPQ
jgi:hypothetical protein